MSEQNTMSQDQRRKQLIEELKKFQQRTTAEEVEGFTHIIEQIHSQIKSIQVENKQLPVTFSSSQQPFDSLAFFDCAPSMLNIIGFEQQEENYIYHGYGFEVELLNLALDTLQQKAILPFNINMQHFNEESQTPSSFTDNQAMSNSMDVSASSMSQSTDDVGFRLGMLSPYQPDFVGTNDGKMQDVNQQIHNTQLYQPVHRTTNSQSKEIHEQKGDLTFNNNNTHQSSSSSHARSFSSTSSSAVSTSHPSIASSNTSVQELLTMGFTAESAIAALEQCNNNIEQAVHMLLTAQNNKAGNDKQDVALIADRIAFEEAEKRRKQREQEELLSAEYIAKLSMEERAAQR